MTTSRVSQLAEADLPTRAGPFRILAFAVADSAADHVALIHGDPADAVPPLVRLHSQCLTGDALGSLRCDCGEQLMEAQRLIVAAGRGIVIYLPQEGRGIGLANKIRAYALQDRGLDTVDANVALGFPIDGRDYEAAADILRFLGVTRVRLLTNNPAKQLALAEHDIEVVERVPLEMPLTVSNGSYLRTKALRMGHVLAIGPQDEQAEPATGTQLQIRARSNGHGPLP